MEMEANSNVSNSEKKLDYLVQNNSQLQNQIRTSLLGLDSFSFSKEKEAQQNRLFTAKSRTNDFSDEDSEEENRRNFPESNFRKPEMAHTEINRENSNFLRKTPDEIMEINSNSLGDEEPYEEGLGYGEPEDSALKIGGGSDYERSEGCERRSGGRSVEGRLAGQRGEEMDVGYREVSVERGGVSERGEEGMIGQRDSDLENRGGGLEDSVQSDSENEFEMREDSEFGRSLYYWL